jgi:hypothetical protein
MACSNQLIYNSSTRSSSISTSKSRSSRAGSESKVDDFVVISGAIKQRDDLKQKFGSKSPLGEYLGSLYDASAIHMLADLHTVDHLFHIILQSSDDLESYEKGMKVMSKASSESTSEESVVFNLSIDDVNASLKFNTINLIVCLSRFFPSVSYSV